MGSSKGAKQVTYQEPEPVKQVSQEEREIRDNAQAQAARSFGTAGTDITKAATTIDSGDTRTTRVRGKEHIPVTTVKKANGQTYSITGGKVKYLGGGDLG